MAIEKIKILGAFLELPATLSCQFCRVLCAQQRTCQKVDEDFLKQMWSSRIIQILSIPAKI